MSDNSVDPSGNTEAFRAFNRDTPTEQTASRTPLIITGVVVVVAVLVALIVYLAA